MIVNAIAESLADMQSKVQSVDTLPLTAEQRQRPHMRIRTRGGREIAISLPRGVELNDGDVLGVENGVAVVVEAALEDLLEIFPDTAREWGLACYQLGNLHRELRFLDDSMLTLYDRTCEEVLTGMNVRFQRIHRPFIGDRYGAYTGHLHDQAHQHSHDEDNSHDHQH